MADHSYSSYIKVPQLLALQQPLSDPMEHDEMLFIVIHQVYELWFKEILHELDAVRARLLEGAPLHALKSMRRINVIQRTLNAQVDVLETMTPVDFNLFRHLFSSASGFQSVQFRCIEVASGAIDPRVLRPLADQPGMEQVNRRLGEPTLYDALLRHLHREGFAIPARLLAPGGLPRDAARPIEPELVAAFKDLYESATRDAVRYELHLLLEAFVDYEALWITWRHRHIQMVERTIGMKMGTGGSSGAGYLRQTLTPRFFPELFAVRTELGTPV